MIMTTRSRYGLLGAGLLLLPLAHAGVPGDVTLETAFAAGSFDFPVALHHAGDERRFVVERPGRIRLVDAGGNIAATPFLEITNQVDTAGEGGLLGLAFHPDYASNGRLYVNYTYNGNPGGASQLITRISEFQTSAGDPGQANPDSERVILEIPQDFNNHNGGDLHFGPDGLLYIGMGDGGSGNDPCNRAQTLDPDDLADCGNHPTTPAKALLGKMLRIDVDSTTAAGSNNLCAADADGSAPYAVPADNPFLIFADRFESDPPGRIGGVCAETWTYGLRNPYRFSFDRDTGDLFIADVGQNRWEEINFEPAAARGGFNYGWNICEASFFTGTTTPCDLPGHSFPILEYPIQGEDECAVTGGYRYRGPVQSLQGIYVYADYCSGKIWFATETSPGQWDSDLFHELGTFAGVVGFGEDQDGQLYLLRSNGAILRFAGNQ